MTRTWIHQLSRAAALLVIPLAIGASPAHAGLLASEDFKVGSNKAAGEYNVGPLVTAPPSTPTVPGFTGNWRSSTGKTGTWQVQNDGLGTGPGGSAMFNGYNGSKTDPAGIRRVARNLASYDAPDAILDYYMSGIVRLDGPKPGSSSLDLTGLALGGFISKTPTLSNQNFFREDYDSKLQGLMWGFEGDGDSVNLVLRHRDDVQDGAGVTPRMVTTTLLSDVEVGKEYQVVLRLQYNQSTGDAAVEGGNDLVSVWINPADFSSLDALGTPDYEVLDYSLFNPAGIGTLMLAAKGFGNVASFDAFNLWQVATPWPEPEIGPLSSRNLLVSRVPVPEPVTATLAIMSLGSLALVRRRAQG